MSKAKEMEARLTQSDLHHLFDYDPDTGILRWKNPRTNSVKAGQIVGYENGNGYLACHIGNCKFFVHRIIWCYMSGEWPAHDVDHLNGIRTDNRIYNLRSLTRTENLRNQSPTARSSSGTIGVSMFKATGKWRAYLKVSGKQIHLGYFNSFDEAASARRQANIMHGFSERHGRAA